MGSTGHSGPPRGEPQHSAEIDFSRQVAGGGYLWWYVDAISDDGKQALTLIIFIGSVFSPYYHRARQRGPAAAENHCAFNTILYGPGSRKRWSMTERSQQSLQRSPDTLRIGPSQVHWDGTTLVAEVDERCTPFPRRMHGRISVTPMPLTRHSVCLDQRGGHRWHPLAPVARVSVAMDSPGVHWEGQGYLDSNEGNEPLARGFNGWDWSREVLPGGECRVHYETRADDRQPRRFAMTFRRDGSLERQDDALHSLPLPTTPVWRVPRRTLSEDGETGPQVERTLEDTPFYARSLTTRPDGRHAMHESLCLRRFEQRWVQTLLPFRMPRWR